MKIYARERFYTPIEELTKADVSALTKKYTFHFFEEKACNQCEWSGLRRQEGLLGECETCAAYLGSAIWASRVTVGGKPYLATRSRMVFLAANLKLRLSKLETAFDAINTYIINKYTNDLRTIDAKNKYAKHL